MAGEGQWGGEREANRNLMTIHRIIDNRREKVLSRRMKTPLCSIRTLGRQIKVDASELNDAVRAIVRLFEPGTLENIPHEFLDRIKSLFFGGGLEVCVTPFSAASVTDHQVIGLRVGGMLKEVAAAASAMNNGLGINGIGHMVSPHGS
jgi:hypothetical protein